MLNRWTDPLCGRVVSERRLQRLARKVVGVAAHGEVLDAINVVEAGDFLEENS